MEKTTKTGNSSVLYRKIDGLGLPARERSKVMAALESANRLSGAIYWLYGKFEKIVGFVLPNANLKHQ